MLNSSHKLSYTSKNLTRTRPIEYCTTPGAVNVAKWSKWLFPAWLPWLRKIFFNFFLLILIGLDYMVILVYYVTLYVLPLVHKTPQNTKKGQNRQKMDVSCLVTMVKEFIFQFFFF